MCQGKQEIAGTAVSPGNNLGEDGSSPSIPPEHSRHPPFEFTRKGQHPDSTKMPDIWQGRCAFDVHAVDL